MRIAHCVLLTAVTLVPVAVTHKGRPESTKIQHVLIIQDVSVDNEGQPGSVQGDSLGDGMRGGG